jgi:hypothetical protein
MRPSLPALAVLFLGACAELPSTTSEAPSLIVNGEPTGTAFPAVGALMYDFAGDGLTAADQLCTGSLISATVFLTAGHCVAWLPAAAQLHVSFAPDLFATPLVAVPATSFASHPDYTHNSANPRDLAVVLLPNGATAGITPLALPPARHLDHLAARGQLRGKAVINIGYGVSATWRGRPTFGWDGKRRQSSSPFQSLRPANLTLLMAVPATQLGGDCFGDSGGPKFLEGDASTIVATVSWGDIPCRALSVNYRLDTPWARSFLGNYLTLP